MAGFGGSPNMVSGTIMAISKIIYEYKGKVFLEDFFRLDIVYSHRDYVFASASSDGSLMTSKMLKKFCIVAVTFIFEVF